MGGSAAPMEVSEGGKSSLQLATLPDRRLLPPRRAAALVKRAGADPADLSP
ncbi:MAG: hypothetical protein JO161_07035 [Planctomycetaceae bacterium]|nr:hypothetical protein [Planctomycetaceae bacterium]